MARRLIHLANPSGTKRCGSKRLHPSFVPYHLPFAIRHKELIKLLTADTLLYGSLFFLLSTFLLSGCAPQMPIHRQLAPLPSGPICRVAVLPFLNDSDYPLGDAIAQKVFATKFHNTGNYLVIQEGDILKVYQQLQILPGMAPTNEQFQIIADRVNAQLLISGIVMEMREDRGEHNTLIPVIIMDAQIRDGRSGEVLWTTLHRRQGSDYKKTMHFGTIHSVTGLSSQMAEEIINLWYRKGLKQCDVLSQF